jgi:ribosomal protein L11 methyltransferase
MNKKYINLEIKFPEELKDIIIAELSDFPFLGIVEEESSLIISFDKNIVNESLLSELQAAMSHISNEIAIGEFEEIKEENWNKNWENEVPAIKISDKIGIAPEWKIHQLDTEHKITINPKMSFGTGGHETTKLCSIMLENTDLKGKSVLDAGTGTGVLAIIAKLFGAKTVVAFDNNEWSIKNAQENFAINGFANEIDLDQFDLDEEELPQSDIIVANILAHVIKRNMKKFADALEKNGTFIASGILIEQENEIIQEAELFGLQFTEKNHMNEWTVLKYKKK